MRLRLVLILIEVRHPLYTLAVLITHGDASSCPYCMVTAQGLWHISVLRSRRGSFS